MRILKPPTPIYDIADGRITDFKSMKDIPGHRIGKIDSVVFSEEGMAALQTEAPEAVYVMSTQDTNEVEWEHYAAMRELMSSSLKYVDHSLENFMKAMVDAYESLYNHILKEHENGDRKVKFTLTESLFEIAYTNFAEPMKLA